MPTAFPSVNSVPQTLPLVSAENTQADQAESGHRPIGDKTSDETTRSSLPFPSRRSQPNGPATFHRLAEVRAQQGLSLRTVSRRTGIDVKELRRQEQPTCNLTLAQLMVWQKALEVPLVDLLVDESDLLSRPVKERAQMVRIMKTIVSLGEVCQSNTRLNRLTTMLREQVLQLMPELVEIGGWPQCGSRRGSDVLGRIFHEPVKVEFDGE